jgi:IS30 family transposase
MSLDAPSGRYLSFAEREEIALLEAQDHGVRELARRIDRSPSTVSRELKRNAATRSGKLKSRAGVAQWKAELAARRPKTAKLVANPQLREYVQERLAGEARQPDGTVVAGPSAGPWKGRNKPRRQERRWALAWSPEQISHRLKVDFPDDESMRISPEAIYQALYIQGRGALRRELVACLRTGRALRVPRARTRSKPGGHVTAEVIISERPAEAEDRAVPGHREGDLIIGLERSAIGTIMERQAWFTMLGHLPREEGYGSAAPVKNGPALGGYGAVSMNRALAKAMTTMPQQLRQSLTWDRGKKLSAYAAFKVETGTAIYFADPHSPWQRGTNENINGLVRQYFPKGTDLSRWTEEDLEAVAHALNGRPRKTLKWKTPAEAMNDHLLLLEQAGVATTGCFRSVHEHSVHRAPRARRNRTIDRDRCGCLRQRPDGIDHRPVQDRVHRHDRLPRRPLQDPRRHRVRDRRLGRLVQPSTPALITRDDVPRRVRKRPPRCPANRWEHHTAGGREPVTVHPRASHVPCRRARPSHEVREQVGDRAGRATHVRIRRCETLDTVCHSRSVDRIGAFPQTSPHLVCGGRDLGMELHAPSCSADAKRLMRVLRGHRQPAAVPGKHMHCVVVHRSHGKGPEAAEQGVVVPLGSDLHLGDPRLHAGAAACDRSPKGLCEQLPTETDPQRRDLPVDRVL